MPGIEMIDIHRHGSNWVFVVWAAIIMDEIISVWTTAVGTS